MGKIKAKVDVKHLAFWESLLDMCDEPKKYLNYGETVVAIGDAIIYGGLFGDKQYYKVSHPLNGIGYVRKEGLVVQECKAQETVKP